MTIKIFADGADLKSIEELKNNPIIEGYTFNPSLLRKRGIVNFEKFAKDVLKIVRLPVSFEVFSDSLEEMEREAKIISSWGENIFVKIPVMTTEKIKTIDLIKLLTNYNIKLNITCVFTYKQIEESIEALGDNNGIISIFAGRLIDAGYDAKSFIQYAKYNKKPKQQILWASTRGLWNINDAENSGADIITIGPDLLKKMSLIGKNLEEFSWETVCMFRQDSINSGFKI